MRRKVKRLIVLLVMVMIVSMSVPCPALAYKESHSTYAMVYLVMGMPYLIATRGHMYIFYTNYPTPWPGCYRVTDVMLHAEVPNYYSWPYLQVQPPFTILAILPGMSSLARYDDGETDPSFYTTNISVVSGMAEPTSRWCFGEEHTDHDLVKDPGSQYKFTGRVKFQSLYIPTYHYGSVSYTFNFG